MYYNDCKMKNKTSRSFTVKVGHGYRQLLHDVKNICYRCLLSGRYKKSMQKAGAHSHNTLKPTTFSTYLQKQQQRQLQRQQQTCLLSSIYIELLLLSLMITSVVGIGNFSKH